MSVCKLPELPMLRKKKIGQDYLRIIFLIFKTGYYWKQSIYSMPVPQDSFKMICEDERMQIEFIEIVHTPKVWDKIPEDSPIQRSTSDSRQAKSYQNLDELFMLQLYSVPSPSLLIDFSLKAILLDIRIATPPLVS